MRLRILKDPGEETDVQVLVFLEDGHDMGVNLKLRINANNFTIAHLSYAGKLTAIAQLPAEQKLLDTAGIKLKGGFIELGNHKDYY